MAIITKPSAIDKGVENAITLNKADLASDAKVVADSYFSDQNNWKNVYITYKTPEGQVNDVVFDASEASPLGSFNPSLKALDTWEVQSVTIQDFDNGSLKLFRGDLTVAEFDIVLGGSLASYFILDYNNISSSNGLSNVTSTSADFGGGAYMDFPVTSDVLNTYETIEIRYDAFGSSKGVSFTARTTSFSDYSSTFRNIVNGETTFSITNMGSPFNLDNFEVLSQDGQPFTMSDFEIVSKVQGTSPGFLHEVNFLNEVAGSGYLNATHNSIDMVSTSFLEVNVVLNNVIQTGEQFTITFDANGVGSGMEFSLRTASFSENITGYPVINAGSNTLVIKNEGAPFTPERFEMLSSNAGLNVTISNVEIVSQEVSPISTNYFEANFGNISEGMDYVALTSDSVQISNSGYIYTAINSDSFNDLESLDIEFTSDVAHPNLEIGVSDGMGGFASDSAAVSIGLNSFSIVNNTGLAFLLERFEILSFDSATITISDLKIVSKV